MDAPEVPGSTPVIAFGDLTTARVASLRLNPSRLEFLSSTGTLIHANRRFETLPSLGVTRQLTVRRRWNDTSVGRGAAIMAVLAAAAVLTAGWTFSRSAA